MNLRWRVLIGLAALAVAVEASSVLGWMTWGRAWRTMEVQPEAGARRLAESPLLSLPSTVWWARRLGGSLLDGVPADLRATLLERVGTLQLRWMPTDPAGPRNLTLAALARGDTDAAMGFVQEALGRWPVSPYLVRLKALLMLRRGDYEGCLELLARAQGLAPGFSFPRVEVLPGDDAWVRLEGLRQRAALYPRLRSQAILDMARELRRQGRLQEASRVLDEISGTPLAELERASWELADGAFEAAASRARVQATRKELPPAMRARAWALASRALSAAGREAEALSAAREALRLAPDSPGPYLALASMAERRGEMDRALENARRAWGVAPGDVRVLLTVARIAREAGKGAEARLALRRAVEVAPDRPDLRARLAALLLEQGRYMEAALTLSSALDRFPTDARLLRLAGRLESETTGKTRGSRGR